PHQDPSLLSTCANRSAVVKPCQSSSCALSGTPAASQALVAPSRSNSPGRDASAVSASGLFRTSGGLEDDACAIRRRRPASHAVGTSRVGRRRRGSAGPSPCDELLGLDGFFG